VPIAVRSLGLAPPPVRWTEARQRNTRLAATVVLVASWVSQLHRFDWI